MDTMEDFLYDKEPRSHQQYSNCFKRFLSYLKEQGHISDGELSEQATQFLQKAKNAEDWAQQQLINFIMALGQRKEKKIEAATIKNYYKVVKAFCLLHRINLEWPRIKRYIGKVKKIANDRAPSLDEMKTWMEYDDRRIKLVILVMWQGVDHPVTTCCKFGKCVQYEQLCALMEQHYLSSHVENFFLL
jgi:hypothetical protein